VFSFKRTFLLILTVICCLSSHLAFADYYAGTLFSYTSSEYTHSSLNSSSEGSPLLLQAQLGYYFNDYLALEGRYGVSAKRSDGISIDRLGSVLVKGNLPVSKRIAMYALAGFSSAKLEQQNIGSSSESGTSFGLGMHYAFDKRTAITLECLSSLKNDSAKIGGLSVAYQYRF